MTWLFEVPTNCSLFTALLIMRTYALYEKRLYVLLFLCLSALAVIVYGVVSSFSRWSDFLLKPQSGP